MTGLNGRVNKLEQQAISRPDKRRLVLYHTQTDRYANSAHSYTADDLPALREKWDLMIIEVVRDR